uniref:RNA polymerase II transcription factor B subunit 2 n=1 Tax=Aegilops tauschii subsp. strangulata TaxID=200361 RepID=A0A453DGU1_AEGTS
MGVQDARPLKNVEPDSACKSSYCLNPPQSIEKIVGSCILVPYFVSPLYPSCSQFQSLLNALTNMSCRVEYQLPNLIVGAITKESLYGAFDNGITAEQVIVLITHFYMIHCYIDTCSYALFFFFVR